MQNTISEISGVKYDLDIFPTDLLGVIKLACESKKQECVRVCECVCLCLLPLRRALLAQLKQPHKIRGTCVNVTVHRRHSITHTQAESRGVPVEWMGNPCQGRPSRSWPNKQMMSLLAGAQRGRSCSILPQTIPPLWARLSLGLLFCFLFLSGRFNPLSTGPSPLWTLQ